MAEFTWLLANVRFRALLRKSGLSASSNEAAETNISLGVSDDRA
jgi:hypothetical protein